MNVAGALRYAGERHLAYLPEDAGINAAVATLADEVIRQQAVIRRLLIARNVRLKRTAAPMDMIMLSDRTKGAVSASYIREMEHGDGEPTQLTIDAVAAALGMTSEELEQPGRRPTRDLTDWQEKADKVAES